MKRSLERVFGAVLLLVVGATLGPVIVAAVGAWAFSDERPYLSKSREASRLIEAYRLRLPERHLFLSITPPDDGTECGYDSSELFPEPMDQLSASIQSQKFTDYSGYYALDRWRNDSRDEEWISAITASINLQLSEFETGFLRRCIEATMFSDICMERVAKFGDSENIPRFDHDRQFSPPLGTGIEDQIVCTYVDGVAARKRIPLSSWNFDKDIE